MKFIAHTTLLRRILCYLCAFALALAASLFAQSFSTTAVQGTVYLANGNPGAGTLQLTWPAFTTAAGQAVAAGRLIVEIGSNGFMNVNLAPNQGASPAGLYYTAVYHLNDGTTSTEYWTVPATAQATIAQVRAQVMPAAQAVQAVSKTYVDQSIQELTQSMLTSSGGNLIGPLYLKEDPQSSSEAATKHYVDSVFNGALPIAGGVASGPITGVQIGAIFQVDQQAGSNFGAKLQACIRSLAGTSGGTCDARNFSGMQSITSDLTLSTANITIHLPCATISTSNAIVITPGTRNVTLHGCALRGTSASSGSQGGTVFLYSGVGTLFQVGDSTYATDTLGFHLDNVVVNTADAESQFAQPFAAWRTQELNLQNLYLLGNFKQTAMTLDGTGNYTGGTFENLQITGFNTAVNAIGHQSSNSAPTDWLNASTFVRLHINCPVSNGNPIDGTTGINLAQGDGNTFTGGDVEGCATALHLGPNAQNNTIVGLRTENSTNQVIADAGSAYNNWITGGTLFTGKLTDNGTRNSFTDTFHRTFNGLKGDWFGTQQDTTLTNHFRLGIGTGNERGLLNRYQTDYGYRWTMGLSDATGGAQFYQILDELNNVYRVSLGQYNDGQASTNNQTVLNSAGTGAIVLNGSNRAGTGGVVFGSGGANSTTVATVNNTGNAQFNGTLLVGGTSQSTGTMTVRNNADAEVDYYLWPGLTTNQKGSFTYKDYAGNSQWYMVKDAGNNWALNSAIGGLDSIKAYQSNNSGDTYINAANSSGAVRINYETGAGSAFHIYGGSSSNLYASFLGANAIKFPGLAAGSGRNCLQIDNTGYLSNTGSPCGSGSGGGTVNSGNAGQIAYYNASGASISGLNAVPLSAGGTGALDAPAALANLGALPTAGGSLTGSLSGTSASFSGAVSTGVMSAATINGVQWVTPIAGIDVGTTISNCIESLPKDSSNQPYGTCNLNPARTWGTTAADGSPFAVSIVVPPNVWIDGQGAVLTWTGTQASVTSTSTPFVLASPQASLQAHNGGIRNLTLLEGYSSSNANYGWYFGGDPAGMISPSTYYGSGYQVKNITVSGFHAGMSYGNNTFRNSISDVRLVQNYDGVENFPGTSNSGENLSFTEVNVSNNYNLGFNLQAAADQLTISGSCDYNINGCANTDGPLIYQGHMEGYKGPLVTVNNSGSFTAQPRAELALRYEDWNSSSAYSEGQTVLYTGNNHYFQSLQAANQGNAPSISPAWWSDLGAQGNESWVQVTGANPNTPGVNLNNSYLYSAHYVPYAVYGTNTQSVNFCPFGYTTSTPVSDGLPAQFYSGGSTGVSNCAVGPIQVTAAGSVPITVRTGGLGVLVYNPSLASGQQVCNYLGANSTTSTANANAVMCYNRGTSSTNGTLSFGFTGSGNTTWLTIDPSGNVGIGNAVPTSAPRWWDKNGLAHQNAATPTASAGTVTGTNEDGAISGLSNATLITLTFANSGWTNWANCVASTSVSGNPAWISSINKAVVQFGFPSSFSGTVYYHCAGN